MRVVCWDLDQTMLDTEGRLFPPIIDTVSEFSGRSRHQTRRLFNEVNAKTFSWDAWFRSVNLEQPTASWLRGELEKDIAQRIEDCLFPGIRETLEECHRSGIRNALVTAGDRDWQRWKFERIACLQLIFEERDRHYIPLDGSKGECIASYGGESEIYLVEDAVVRLREAKAHNPSLRGIRVMWEGSGAKDDPDDGRLWDVARNANELMALLRREVN